MKKVTSVEKGEDNDQLLFSIEKISLLYIIVPCYASSCYEFSYCLLQFNFLSYGVISESDVNEPVLNDGTSTESPRQMLEHKQPSSEEKTVDRSSEEDVLNGTSDSDSMITTLMVAAGTNLYYVNIIHDSIYSMSLCLFYLTITNYVTAV